MKNPPEFYDLEYLQNISLRWAGGSTRWDDNGSFYNAAQFVQEFVRRHIAALHRTIRQTPYPSVLEVGCGRGWVVQHLRRMGIYASGCEYGVAARENSVLEDVMFGDLSETLPYRDNEFDLVYCVGVLSHLPAELADHAIAELRRVTKRFLWTNILVVPPNKTLEDLPRVKLEQGHHLNIVGSGEWLERFENAALQPYPAEDLLQKYFGTDDTAQWHVIWEKA